MKWLLHKLQFQYSQNSSWATEWTYLKPDCHFTPLPRTITTYPRNSVCRQSKKSRERFLQLRKEETVISGAFGLHLISWLLPPSSTFFLSLWQSHSEHVGHSRTLTPFTSIGGEKYSKLKVNGSLLPCSTKATMGCAEYYSLLLFYCNVFLHIITFPSAVCS